MNSFCVFNLGIEVIGVFNGSFTGSKKRRLFNG